MCGIWAVFGAPAACHEEYAKKILARGPEQFRFVAHERYSFGFARLAINCLDEVGMPPFEHKGLSWICNGEIYNCREVVADYAPGFPLTADTSCIGPVWDALGPANAAQCFRAFDGGAAWALVDHNRNLGVICRDAYGVRPMFYGTRGGKLFVASELKGLAGLCDDINQWEPGTGAIFSLDTPTAITKVHYHEVPWLKSPLLSPGCPGGEESALEAIRFSLTYAVRKRMMTERPVAALLSGGLDSSLIASIAQSELKKAAALADTVPRKLQTFSIGFADSPDLQYARMVARHIGSEHHELICTPDEFFQAVPEVIRVVESFDITTVRASVGNWLIAREVRRQSDCKVLFNGDGSDEVLGGYLYFMKASSDGEFEAESARLLKEIHRYDGLRSDRSVACHGLEARTPFLDKQFVAVARSVASIWRRPVDGRPEKWVLRKAFDGTGALPAEVLWRQKEAFSDGVSSHTKSWYEEIADRVSQKGIVPDDWEQVAEEAMGQHLPPPTVEAFYYRQIFESYYGASSVTVIPHFWMPRWCGETTDPSARTLAHYDKEIATTTYEPTTPAVWGPDDKRQDSLKTLESF